MVHERREATLACTRGHFARLSEDLRLSEYGPAKLLQIARGVEGHVKACVKQHLRMTDWRAPSRMMRSDLIYYVLIWTHGRAFHELHGQSGGEECGIQLHVARASERRHAGKVAPHVIHERVTQLLRLIRDLLNACVPRGLLP